ncbi:hypothetical protein GOC18_24090 [Sinorhizobium meliloti]|uniref:hypothetical protein n=1 Tax=Rhizobium meliloti TaxID=382 RepID=UPI0029AACDF8|nr:hypothetical protein [Sinorhizobium meliloti]
MSSETPRSTANRSAMSKPPSASAFHQASRKFATPAALAGIVVGDVQQVLEGKSDAVFHVFSSRQP